VHKGLVYFGSEDGNFYALDAKTGEERWRFATNMPILSWPVVDGDAVYFGSNNRTFYAFSLDGRMIWSFKTRGDAGLFNAVVHNNTVYFGSFDRNVYAVSADNGRLMWNFTLSEPPNTVFCIWEGMLYFGSRNCNFYSVDSKGRLVWQYKTNAPLAGGATVEGGVVYIGGADNALHAVDARTGALAWKFRANGYIAHTNPAVCNGKIYFGCWDCNLYCIDMNGSLVWKFRTSLSYPAPVELESSEVKRTMEVTLRFDGEKKAGKADEAGMSDYGEFSGTYIQKEKTDYVSGRKRGYIK
jgi:outer membrane protein assembly factor BamB